MLLRRALLALLWLFPACSSRDCHGETTTSPPRDAASPLPLVTIDAAPDSEPADVAPVAPPPSPRAVLDPALIKQLGPPRAACAASAPTPVTVTITLTVDADANITNPKTTAPADAPAPLVTCVDQQLAKLTFPKTPMPFGPTVLTATFRIP